MVTLMPCSYLGGGASPRCSLDHAEPKVRCILISKRTSCEDFHFRIVDGAPLTLGLDNRLSMVTYDG